MPIEVEEQQPILAAAKRSRRGPRILFFAAIVLAICTVAGVMLWKREWPFTRDSILLALQQQSGGKVQVESFRQTYFPPGCTAEGISIRRSENSLHPFLTIQKLTIIGSYHGLLFHHISTIRAEGLGVHLGPQAQQRVEADPSGGFNVGTLSDGLSIGQIIADGATVELAPTAERKQPMIFRTPKLTLHDLSAGKPLAFETTVQIPQPAAEVDVTGGFGAWREGHGGESKLSGSYNLRSLDLGSFHDIGGILTSKGNFDGVVQRVAVKGAVDTPNFTVSSSGHRIHMTGQFEAVVNGLNGDVGLNAARVQYGKTEIQGAGSVSGEEGQKGKVAKFYLSSNKARVQDLLWIFISENTPPMAGPIIFRAQATIPPTDRPFLNKLVLDGDFGISDARYPHPDTQRNIDVLSARARGQADKVEDAAERLGTDNYDPGRVLANVKGHVHTTNAVAHLSNVMFDVPGASAKMNGTYQLTSHQVDLRGYMHLESELSKTTTGVKSVLLKMAHPFMKKGKRNASVIAITIGGTYEHPTYEVVPKREK
jgi:hypothetical protein